MRALLILLVACRKEEPPPSRYAPVEVPVVRADAAPAPVALDASIAVDPDAALAPTVDGGPVDYSKLLTAEWPTAMEFVKAERYVNSGRYELSIDYVKLRTKPKALADAMNAVFTEHINVDFKNDKDSSGRYDYHCEPVTISRLAVVIRCGKMVDSHTDEQIATGTGGSPGGLTPTQYSWWLQPGLPPLTIDQLAPGIDIAKLLATANKIQVKGCEMSNCELRAEHFTIDTDGVTFQPSQYCYGCTDEFPKIPLAQLKPAHPWAKKLVEWIHQRADAGEHLVKYEATQ